MSHLPVIVGFGGINSAGRSSSHYAYRRLVIDSLSPDDASSTLRNLAVLRGMISKTASGWVSEANESITLSDWLESNRASILQGTLIRKMGNMPFDPEALLHHQPANISGSEDTLSFTLKNKHLPQQIPENWQVINHSDGRNSTVNVTGSLDLLFPDSHQSAVHAAGQLPEGFKPDALYSSRNHPRGLQMAIYGISDALNSMGIDWQRVLNTVAPDQISVYAGSSMGQLDQHGNGGMLQARLLGKKVKSKQLPLAFCEMPADFINAYVIGNLGGTGTNLGACATFHYNLSMGIRDIQNGTHRVVIVGGSEAPITPEIIEGFVNMGALADDEKLMALDAHLKRSEPDYNRACRPFGNNVGFTLGESAQFVVLFDDALALELGATIHGAVNDVFVNADGYKKSIASPGIGNYLTVAKAAAATRAVIGEKGLKQHTFVQAHGTGTPQNRVTESAIFHDIAREFGIDHWPITAVKSYLGHSLCCSGADQLMASLGVWQYGLIPGILTTDEIADDVEQKNLDYLLAHKEVEPDSIKAVLLNAKGFGGNNATASILSPSMTRTMLKNKHGEQALSKHAQRNEHVKEISAEYEHRTGQNDVPPSYHFDNDVKVGADVSITSESLRVRAYPKDIDLKLDSRYPDMEG